MSQRGRWRIAVSRAEGRRAGGQEGRRGNDRMQDMLGVVQRAEVRRDEKDGEYGAALPIQKELSFEGLSRHGREWVLM